jgi:outer membrane protein W
MNWKQFFITAVSLVLLLVSLHVPKVSAENSEITFYAGGFLGDSFISTPSVLFPSVEAVFDDEFTGGIRYAYFLTNHLAVEMGGGFTPSSVATRASFSNGVTYAASVIHIDTYVLHANLLAHLYHGPIIPFVTGGVGAVHFGFDTNHFGFARASETDFAWNAGAGFKIPIKSDTAIRLDGRYYWLKPEFSDEDTSTFLELSGGVSILFDF